jgi:hypothetical protein
MRERVKKCCRLLCNLQFDCCYHNIPSCFDVSLTVHLSITSENDQLNAQVFKYLYYDPLHVHVWSNILLILWRSTFINTASGILTLKRSEFSRITIIYYIQYYNNYIIVILDNSLLFRVRIADAVLIQFDLLRMSKITRTCIGS